MSVGRFLNRVKDSGCLNKDNDASQIPFKSPNVALKFESAKTKVKFFFFFLFPVSVGVV